MEHPMLVNQPGAIRVQDPRPVGIRWFVKKGSPGVIYPPVLQYAVQCRPADGSSAGSIDWLDVPVVHEAPPVGL